jgi:hypothetical protein
MSETPEATKRKTWVHKDIPKLVMAFHEGGVSAAHKAFPDRPRSEVADKLTQLGLMAISAEDAALVGQIAAIARKAENPALVAKAAAKAMREIAAETK